MAGRDYREVIIQEYPDENPDDVIFMIEAIARRRADRLNTELTDEVYDFAAKVICVILDPVKSDAYQQAMSQVRETFKGIATSSSTAEAFAQAMTDELLIASSATEAIKAGVFQLLRVPQVSNK